MGPPGCQKQDNAQEIAKKFGWDCLSAGELLRKEVKDKTEKGKKIDECFKQNQYVEDEVVVEVVSLAV
jgi:adenylate kinase